MDGNTLALVLVIAGFVVIYKKCVKAVSENKGAIAKGGFNLFKNLWK